MLKYKLRQMWIALLEKIGFVPKVPDTFLRRGLQPIDDIYSINYLDIAAGKLTNLACVEATNDIESDSALAEPLKEKSSELQERKADIVYGALTKGGFYEVPYFDGNGKLQLMPLDSDYVKIIRRAGKRLKELYITLKTYTPDKGGVTYFLIRHHALDDLGDLHINYMVMEGAQEKGIQKQSAYIPDDWQNIIASESVLRGVNHIGVGYYRSPVPTRGIVTDEGVPLDFGCAEIINELRELRKEIAEEYKNAKTLIFADPRILKRDEQESKYKIIENIFAVERRAGIEGSMIDTYSPEIRFSPLHDREQSLYADLENQMKLSRGIFTENQFTAGATATEVKRSNKDTIAMVDKLHKMLDSGDVMTLEACGMYLGIRRDLWEYKSDYYDPFDDAGEQWNYLKQAYDVGAVSLKRLTKWVSPSSTDEEIEQELAQAREEKQTGTQTSIEAMLNM